MVDYSLTSVQTGVLEHLCQLAKIVRAIRTLTETGKLDSPEATAQGNQWGKWRLIFENDVVKPLPRHVRQRLLEGEDSVTHGWVLRFQPRDATVVEQLERYMRLHIKAAGGWLRCTDWDSHDPLIPSLFTIKAFLQNPDWIPDWTGVEVAIKRAKQVFAQYEASDRSNLAPNEEDIEASIRDIIDAYQPDWIPDGEGFEPSQFALMLETGTLQIPYVLEVHALANEIRYREDPFQVRELVSEVLNKLQLSGELKLFRYRPVDESKEYFYYYWAKRRTPAIGSTSGAESARDNIGSSATEKVAANIFRQRNEFWEVRFQGHPTPPAIIPKLVGMARIRSLLFYQGKFLPAMDLARRDKTSRIPRTVGSDHAAFAQGAEGESYLDLEGKNKYEKRLAEITEELTKAGNDNDEAAKERLQKEKDSLVKTIMEAVAPNGKLRKKVDPDKDRARKAVSLSIDNALDKLRKGIPELADHLKNNIQKGFDFCYKPHEEIQWELIDRLY